MKKYTKPGFTLIELLITISIIGVLAAVILASLNDARERGVTAKIQTEMDGIAKRASIIQTTTDDYDEVCGSNGATQSSVVSGLITSIESLSAGVVCNSDTDEFAVSAPLRTGGHWCVDSTGVRKEIPDALITTPGNEEFECP